MQTFRAVVVVALCLAITAPGSGWAEPAQGHSAELDGPHRGVTLRIGAAFGALHGEGIDVTAYGATVALGYRVGRLAVEAELDDLQLSGATGIRIGTGRRLGGHARFEVVSFGPAGMGLRPMAIYVEGGAAMAWNTAEPQTAAPFDQLVDSRRIEGEFGAGFVAEASFGSDPLALPRAGLLFGWRMAALPSTAASTPLCRTDGAPCRLASPLPAAREPSLVHAMMVLCGLGITW